MFGKLFGRKDNSSGAPFYRPYRGDAANQIYNLLFCDNPALFRNGESAGGALGAVLSEQTKGEALEDIGNNLEAESRVRALAFNRLRAMNLPVPPKLLLGTIIEFPQRKGLDTLAIFADKRLRYINHSEKMAIFETSPPTLIFRADKVLRASQFAINQHGPADEPRRPPPTGKNLRLSFLVSDGLYFAEGQFGDLMGDRYAGPVLDSATDLLPVLVEEGLKRERAK